jgi:hypothetical protein
MGNVGNVFRGLLVVMLSFSVLHSLAKFPEGRGNVPHVPHPPQLFEKLHVLEGNVEGNVG